jgi:hypothetical protein
VHLAGGGTLLWRGAYYVDDDVVVHFLKETIVNKKIITVSSVPKEFREVLVRDEELAPSVPSELLIILIC